MQTRPIYRMSEVGMCPRALSAQRLNYEAEPEPEWLATAAEEGKWHEERVRNKLRGEGYTVGDDQKEVRLDFPTFTLLGHIDGLVLDNKEPFSKMLLEIKSMSQFEFDRWMRDGFAGFSQYADQITCYLEATGLEKTLYIVKNRSSGYEYRAVTPAPSKMDSIIGKLTGVETDVQAEELSKATFDPNSIECRRCRYKNLCIPEPKELEPATKIDLDLASERWREGEKIMEAGQELIDKARETFREHTKATGINKWQHNSLAIQLVFYREQNTYPKKKLLEIFTEEQLELALQIKSAYEQLKIEDLRKEEKNK